MKQQINKLQIEKTTYSGDKLIRWHAIKKVKQWGNTCHVTVPRELVNRLVQVIYETKEKPK